MSSFVYTGAVVRTLICCSQHSQLSQSFVLCAITATRGTYCPPSFCFIEQVRPTVRPCLRGKTATENWEKESPIVSPTRVYLVHNVLHSPSLFSMHGNLDFFFSKGTAI